MNGLLVDNGTSVARIGEVEDRRESSASSHGALITLTYNIEYKFQRTHEC